MDKIINIKKKKEKGEIEIIKSRKFTKYFTKEDTRHYVIYRELNRYGIYDPFKKATKIMSALKELKLI